MSVTSTPSSVQLASCGRVPFEAKFDCWPVSLPPMLTRSTSTPGTLRISANGSREVGIFWSSSDAEVGGGAGRLGVDDRRRAADGDGFGDGRDLHLRPAGRWWRRPRRHVLPHGGAEALATPWPPCRSGRQIQEAELAGLVGSAVRGPIGAGDCDRDTGQDAALFVGDRSRQRRRRRAARTPTTRSAAARRPRTNRFIPILPRSCRRARKNDVAGVESAAPAVPREEDPQ